MKTAFPVSIIVGFQSTCDNRWKNGYWKVTGLVAGGTDGTGVQRQSLHAATEGAQYLWTGLSVELHRDDAESYYFNIISDSPRVFVICSQQEDSEPLKPFIATLSYDEAASYMEADEVVESVEMPAELYRWVEQYVLDNYLPEKKKKRKRDNWKEVGSEKFARR